MAGSWSFINTSRHTVINSDGKHFLPVPITSTAPHVGPGTYRIDDYSSISHLCKSGPQTSETIVTGKPYRNRQKNVSFGHFYLFLSPFSLLLYTYI